MKRLTFTLDDETIEKLKKLEETTDIPKSRIIRRAIEEYYENRSYEMGLD